MRMSEIIYADVVEVFVLPVSFSGDLKENLGSEHCADNYYTAVAGGR